MAKKEKKPAIMIRGWLLLYPDGRTEMPDIYGMKQLWEKNGVTLNVRKNIEDAIETMYGLPLQHNRHYISMISQQPLYREMERTIQKMPEWQELKASSCKSHQEKEEAKKLSEIDLYHIKMVKEVKVKILKHEMRKNRI